MPGCDLQQWVGAALSHPCFTGISRQHLGDLIAELADPWTAQQQAALARRRGHGRRRAVGAGPHHRLAFCDRVLATLVHLRLQLSHQALAVLLGVDRSTVTRAVHEVRPLLARGFAVPDQPELWLRTLADAVAYADACGVQLRIDGTETQVRRPRAHRPGRRAFISGKRKQQHHQAHRLQRRRRPHAVDRGGSAGPHARPDRHQDRGHR